MDMLFVRNVLYFFHRYININTYFICEFRLYQVWTLHFFFKTMNKIKNIWYMETEWLKWKFENGFWSWNNNNSNIRNEHLLLLLNFRQIFQGEFISCKYSECIRILITNREWEKEWIFTVIFLRTHYECIDFNTNKVNELLYANT